MPKLFNKTVFFQDTWPNAGQYVGEYLFDKSDLYYGAITDKRGESPFAAPADPYQPPTSASPIIYPPVSGSIITLQQELDFKTQFLEDISTASAFYFGGRHVLKYRPDGKFVPIMYVGRALIFHPQDFIDAIARNPHPVFVAVFAGYLATYFARMFYTGCLNLPPAGSKRFVVFFTPHYANNVQATDFQAPLDAIDDGTLTDDPSILFDPDFCSNYCKALGARDLTVRRVNFSPRTPDTDAERIDYLMRYERVFSIFNYITSEEQ